MRYLVLRRRREPSDDPFLEPAGQLPLTVSALPFTSEVVELTDREAGKLAGDSDVESIVPSIPFVLIEPVTESQPVHRSGTVWGLEAVGVDRSPFTGRGVSVAILDTGIDWRSPAFSGRHFGLGDLMDFTGDERGVPGGLDTNGHGTHVAATIFGYPVDGSRIGVAPGIDRALIGKVLGPRGGSTETVFNAIEWALLQRADVISMSLGIDFPGMVARLVDAGIPVEVATSRALHAYRANLRLFDRLAILIEAQAAQGRGGLVVAAAGNESLRDRQLTVELTLPAAAEGFISVGAVGPGGSQEFPFVVAAFSNSGCYCSGPGVGIRSAALRSGLIQLSGTSMAVPHVVGVLALWIEQLFPDGARPHKWTDDVRRELERHLIRAPRSARADFGLGIVQAPS